MARAPLLALLAALAAAHPAAAQQTPPAAPADSGVTLNFQDADLRVVIASLAELAGIAVSYAALPSRPVTLRTAAPVPREQLRAILESVARANGLALVQEGGIVRIEPQPQEPAAGGAREPAVASAGSGEIRFYVYRLRHARAEAVATVVRELFGLGGRSGEGSPGLDRPGASRDAGRDLLPNPLAAPPEPPPPGAPPPSGVSAGLPAQLRSAVQLIPDPLTNSLLVRSAPEDFAVVRAAVEQLDVRPLQVLIEVLIAEVRHDRQLDLGLSVTVDDRYHPRRGVTIGGELQGGSTGDVALRVLGIGAVRADVVLSALSASAGISVLSRPVVLAQNNQEARILVGSQRPFVQLQRALPTDAAVRDQVIQYRDVGTQLSITPTINPDGYVTLNVRQEVSGATTETQFGAPVISTREVETQLFVRDGHTAVIGGLVDRQREESNSGIPLLRDLPLIGHAFRSTHRRQSATELFLLLTPHVIRSDEELDGMTEGVQEATPAAARRLESIPPIVEPAPPVKRKQP